MNIVTEEGKLVCPRCLREADILEYTPLQHPEEYNEEYADQCAQILKCGACRFVFAPLPNILYNIEEKAVFENDD